MFCSVLVSLYAEKVEDENIRRRTNGELEILVQNIEFTFQKYQDSLTRLGQRFETENSVTAEKLAIEAGFLESETMALLSVDWTDENYTVRWIAPSRYEPIWLGRSLKGYPERLAFFDRVREAGKAHTTGIYGSLEGGVRLAIHAPVEAGGAFRGFVGALLDGEQFFRKVSAQSESIHVAITSSIGDVFRSPTDYVDTASEYYNAKEVNLSDVVFKIESIPTNAFVKANASLLPKAILTFSFVLSALVTWAHFQYTVIKFSREEVKRQATALTRTAGALTIQNAERRRAEERLEEAQRVAQVGSWEFNTATRELDWSPEMYNLCGRDPAKGPLAAAAFDSIVHPDDVGVYQEARHKVLTSNDQVAFTNRLIMPDGHVKFVRFVSRSVVDDDGNLVRRIGVAQDVTDQKELEEKLRHAERLNAVGQLTGGVAHDFNNIMAIISGTANYIGMITKGNDAMSENVARILKAVKRGASLTDKLLSFSRKQSLKSEEIELITFMEETGKVLDRTLGEGVQINVDVAEDLWRLSADENQLSNPLLNLALNARDAMKGSGKINITFNNVKILNAQEVSHGSLGAGDYVLISVSDTGSGIPSGDLEKAVEPFFTTKDVGEGSGLGLSMVHGFCEQSNGALGIQSEVGVGTKVNLFLPASREHIEVKREKCAETEHQLPNHRKVLIVEDQEELRVVTEEIFRRLGYSPVVASNAVQAKEIAANQDSIDLAFLDVILPGGVNGVDLASALGEQYPSLPVIFTTGYASEEVLKQIDKIKCRGLIRKPFEIGALRKMLATATDFDDALKTEGQKRLAAVC